VSRRLWHTKNNTTKRQATPGVPRSRSRSTDGNEPTRGIQRQLERVRCELATARQEVDLREDLLSQLQLEAQAQVDDDDAELVELEDYQARDWWRSNRTATQQHPTDRRGWTEYQVQAALETLQLKVSAQESQIKNLQLELMRVRS